MLTPANAKRMRFTGRYPPDKIISETPYEGSFIAVVSSNPGFGHRSTVVIPHSFGETCFLQMVYSIDGGSSWQDMNTAVPDISTPESPVFQTVYVGCYSTATTFVVVASNYTATQYTVLYKMVAMSKE